MRFEPSAWVRAVRVRMPDPFELRGLRPPEGALRCPGELELDATDQQDAEAEAPIDPRDRELAVTMWRSFRALESLRAYPARQGPASG